jgi:hypothetical protein
VTDYITPNGQIQTLYMPMSDFAARADPARGFGANFDFVHFKDFTFVEMTPGVPMEFYRFTLVGNCGNNNNPIVTTRPAQTTTTAAVAPGVTGNPATPAVTVSSSSTPSPTGAARRNSAVVKGLSIVAAATALLALAF